MSQINTNRVRNLEGIGEGIDVANGGNVSFDTNVLYVDATNDRIGLGTNNPTAALHMEGTTGGLDLNSGPLLEPVNIIANSANGAPNLDISGTGSNHLYTVASTGNFTLNLGTGTNATGDFSSILSAGQMVTVTVFVALGGSSGFHTANVNIAGVSTSVFWPDGEPPDEVGGTSGYDVYHFQIYRLDASTYEIRAGKQYYD